MRTHIFIISILLFSDACQQEMALTTIPDPSLSKYSSCVQFLIESIEANDPQGSPGKIWQVTFQTKQFYFVLPPECCDQFSVLYDRDCNIVCYPDGGISGQGDGKCPATDFKNWKLIWEDKRHN